MSWLLSRRRPTYSHDECHPKCSVIPVALSQVRESILHCSYVTYLETRFGPQSVPTKEGKACIHGCNHQANKRVVGAPILAARLLLYDGEGGARRSSTHHRPGFLRSSSRGPAVSLLHRHSVQ